MARLSREAAFSPAQERELNELKKEYAAFIAFQREKDRSAALRALRKKLAGRLNRPAPPALTGKALRASGALCLICLAAAALSLLPALFHALPSPAGLYEARELPPPVRLMQAPADADLSGPTVCVNKAQMEELVTLPGIGPAIAQRILDERALNGPFYRPEDLLCVRGIGAQTLEKLKPLISFDP